MYTILISICVCECLCVCVCVIARGDNNWLATHFQSLPIVYLVGDTLQSLNTY